jgi:hypothetical protein
MLARAFTCAIQEVEMNRKVLLVLGILGLCASAATATPPPTPTPQANQTPAPAGDASADLRELIVRLVPIGIFGQEEETKPEVVVGALPALFPSEMKLPAGARVLGGVSQGKSNARAALDASQAPDDVVTAIKQSLLAAGWSEPQMMMPGGFQPMQTPTSNALLCKSKEGPAVNVIAQAAREGDGSEVTLIFDTYEQMQGGYSPCNQPADIQMRMPKLPTLIHPRGVKSRSMGAGGGDTSYASYATLLTDQSVDKLRAAYDAQLERAGWTRTAQGADGPVAWSSWRFNDDKGRPQTGVLLVMAQEQNGTEMRNLHLQITMSR